MKRREKIKEWLLTIVALLVISTIILWAAFAYKKGGSVTSVGPSVIAIIILFFAVVMIKKRYTSLKKGLPAEDERSRKVMIIAGYYTFLISLWFLLALAWASDELIKFRYPSQALGAGIGGMAVIFALSWLGVNFLGKTE
jgi:peptidoglycan/LPS O-acetylase OafA/YrhL